MPRGRTFAFLALALLLVCPSRAAFLPEVPFSNDARGTTGAAFLKTPVGARAQALGESYTAVAGDPDALFWNPAGLAEVGRREMTASHNVMLEGAYASALAWGVPVGLGAVAFGALVQAQSPVDAYDAFGDPAGSFVPYDLALSAAYARPVKGASTGAAFKVFRQRLADRTALGWALDYGWQWRNAGLVDQVPVDLGLSVRNLGSPVKLGHRADPMPLKLALGSLWRVDPRFWVLADAHLPVDRSPYASVGMEARLPAAGASFALRMGYSNMRTSDLGPAAGLTAGLGVGLAYMRVDYAWLPMGDLGSTHRVSMGWRF